ncbi:uncharacterized protein FA14DRAFT_158303 [Meira miltonrushii]|uniref:Uncharacterized protein n=1 Tax=Meira miltonrushii TaxID=1280837 RepID=A0A316V4D1_9BASI|nr:uncharacterized protein FA14DRAFT_158303 [Meira miltonrushii]PWN32380.1 hypothetical protein FA14DRAFT_158303 [Meira miltonrushii]
MKWTQSIVLICFALQQACTIQAYVMRLPDYSSIGYDEKGMNPLEDDELDNHQISTNGSMLGKPFHRSFSDLYRIGPLTSARKMKKVIKITDDGFEFDLVEEDDMESNLSQEGESDRSQARGEVQLVKRTGTRGGRRKRVAAQNRAMEAAKNAPAKNAPAKNAPAKGGMSKTKAGLLLAGGAAAGAAAIGMTNGSSPPAAAK